MGLQEAISLFEQNKYIQALNEFISVYNCTQSEEIKNSIVTTISDCFIIPNDKEFREAYKENTSFFKENCNYMNCNIPQYDDLTMDMIPASDNCFFVWNNNSESFEGNIELEEDKCPDDNYGTLLIYGGEIELFDEIRATKYRKIYVVLPDVESRRRFFSYCKIPGLMEKCLDNCYFYESLQQFENHIVENGLYIPRKVIGIEKEILHDVFERVHDIRIRKEKITKPLISISIPSRNRGEATLNNVNHLRKLQYDEEIEIVVSNNGSTVGLDKYEEISRIADEDSRVVYGSFPPADFSASIEQVVSLSNGEFVVLCADEDRFYLECIEDCLNFVFFNRGKGGILFRLRNNKNIILYDDYDNENDVFNSVLSAFSTNYITGICFNNNLLKDNKIVEKLSAMYRGKNSYYAAYPHNTILAYLVRGYGFVGKAPIAFLKYDVSEEIERYSYEHAKADYAYMKLDTRLAHLDALMDIVLDLRLTSDITIGIIVELQDRVYKLMYGAYYTHMEDMVKEYTWDKCCERIYLHNLEMWKALRKKRVCNDEMSLKIELVLKKYYDIHLREHPSFA
ncbi:glycosyltransferase family A protein [Butyrivibrio sp. AD3002]|uniref:glycosyltransferase family A protein n=1 Tax=Butyrivibrio sp. AD3002 TaxID=1280670 RepID=UPI0003B68362|nr:glycosyltransferase family A protein [Butyrivibrio sp. AD3002]